MAQNLPVSPEIVPGDLNTSGEDESHGADLRSCEENNIPFFVLFFYCGKTF